MEIKNLLPIGTIIIMKGGEQPLMIYGVKQTDGGSLFRKVKEYDYICVPYPQGIMGPDTSFLANHEDIKEVIFRGYESDERIKFLDELSEIYKNK